MRRLLITTAALLALATPAMANQTVTVDGLVSLGSSAGMIYNSAGAEYYYARNTRNLAVLFKACPTHMGDETPCVVRFVVSDDGRSVIDIVAALPK